MNAIVIFSIAAFVLGIIIGATIGSSLLNHKKYDGSMIIEDNEESDKVHWTLQYNGDPYEITKKKRVIFLVKH